MTESRRGDGLDDPITEQLRPVTPLGTPLPKRATLVVVSGTKMGAILPLPPGRPLVLGREPACDLPVDDEGVSRRHARVEFHPATGWRLRDEASTNGTFVNGERVAEWPLRDGDRILVGRTVLKFAEQAPVEEQYHRSLYEASTRDALTGCHNRRFFEDRLRSEVAYATRHRSPLSLVMCDLDLFKRVNDTHGHAAGDRVLTEVAACLRGQARAEDLVARWGGEEFALLVRDRLPPGAAELAERIRAAIESLRIHHERVELRVTASLGAFTSPGGPRLEAARLVESADRLLYAAKMGGRNRVCCEVG